MLHMSVGAECLRKATIWNNQICFLISINPSVRCKISEGEKECRAANVFLKLLNKTQSNFNYVTKSRKE